jgi:hypothetical protein
VLDIEPQVRVFKPGLSNDFLRAINILTTPYFWWEVKPGAPCRKVLHHLKITYKYEQKCFARLNSHPFHHSSCLLADVSAGNIARDLSLASQEFSSAYIITPCFSMLIYHLEDQE